jgi:hypothetical protein
VDLSRLRSYATPGVLIASAVLGVVFISAIAIALFVYTPPALTEELLAALTWIPGPTNTPQPPTATAVPTSTVTPTFAPVEGGQIGVGAYVQVSGTGVGLNVRNAPSLTGNIEFLGYDAEVFEVRDGPREADGYTWWYLVTPVDENRAGWAVADFLAVVANP